jgi:hypothetical protein
MIKRFFSGLSSCMCYTGSMHSQTLHMRPLLACGDLVSGPKCNCVYLIILGRFDWLTMPCKTRSRAAVFMACLT